MLEAFAVLWCDSPGWSRGGRLGRRWFGLGERRQDAVLVGVGEAVVDAFAFGHFEIIVIAVDAGRLALVGLVAG